MLTAAAATAATAAAALTAPTATADPRATPAGTKAQVDRLFEEAERATQAYDKADERADRLRREIAHAKDGVARGQERINTMRGALGSLAGAQYRSAGLDPTLALMLSEDPDGYLAKSSALDRLNAHQARRLDKLRTAQRELAQERDETTRKLADLEASRKTVARHKRKVEAKLAEARRLLNSLSPQDRLAYAEGSGTVPELTGTAASGRAAAAVAAVKQAVGRPYVWGANGPGSFDCSGLTQWAYGQAGVGLPRTSQAQRGAGRQVTLAEARPGDLVTYRDDASHIGMYMGGGQVVHAPYPGASVRYDPVGMMPISGITRV
ncbi:NlpC/P60 family protein [Streptomyces sp. B-S-A6]|uniref:NlpC/P60 family protein n=1 Tax=Streptomyces cavernicola TaxID=3043613 RepID=A0ABT6S4P2_9ACTN|nr:C40 family peptidase [Streptomyces sp. B-S-A6]MDI3403071.1 NlpC/P60 family protein [Streptomyces sp. B-S-A6]